MQSNCPWLYTFSNIDYMIDNFILYMQITLIKASIFMKIFVNVFLMFTLQACIGSFGDNCSGGPCTEGYYGHGCRNKCNCTEQQYCNKFEGCVNNTSTSQINSKY